MIARVFRVLPVTVLVFAACDGNPPSMLEPRGPGAARIEGLWWLMFWISAAVVAVVTVMILIAAFRSTKRARPAADVRWGEPFIVTAGVVIPTLILAGVFAVALRDMNALTRPMADANLTVEVTGHLWWWRVTYPDAGVETANEVHIPAGESVKLELTTDDVLHSFWVPQLQAKKDMINGRTNEMWLQADEPGVYRGQCAEFCGLQHANMAFYVVAHEPEDFETWLEDNAADRDPPQTESQREGEEVFLNTTCVGCHSIQGTPARSDEGPDLTHIGSRLTIAAGTLENTRTNLSRWILDPQGVKPGAIMPPTQLSEQELEALLDYLESLD